VLIAFAAALACSEPARAQQGPRVLAVEFVGTVNPVTQDFLVGAIDRAERGGYEAVVLLVDTPGGLDSSMRAIIKKELAARIPVILFVYPPGARAASAGVFLTMAADVAAMAPQTNIGSSTPISIGGEIPEDARRKVINDAAAYIRSLADEHGRNGRWAESAVRRGSNLPAREALERRVIDVVAADVPDLLTRIDGMKTKPKGFVLDTAGAEIETLRMSLWKRILNVAADPNVVVLLLSLGVIGILIELSNPGVILPGAVGAISLILGLFGLQILPVSGAGVLLMLLALGFFAAEAFVTSFGALTLAGAASFFFGSLILFDPAGDAFQVSVPIALAVAATLSLLTAVALTKAVQARRAPPATGLQELIGKSGIVREPLAPLGLVLVNGELWRARAAGNSLRAGEAVLVEGVDDDLVLRVYLMGDRTSQAA
jgi:membrane-bound serine protease (ClpP class)